MSGSQGVGASLGASPSIPGFDDDDDISLTSTIDEHDEEKEYAVENILAEYIAGDDDSDGINQYLVKWDGFPMHECTWEPESNLGEQLKSMWEEDKTKMAEGEQERNIISYQEAKKEADSAKAERHRKRELLRQKATAATRSPIVEQPAQTDQPEISDESDDDYEEADTPLSPQQPRSSLELRRLPKQQMFKGVSKPASGSDSRTHEAKMDSTTSRVKKQPHPTNVVANNRSLRIAAASIPQNAGLLSSVTGYQGTARRLPIARKLSTDAVPEQSRTRPKNAATGYQAAMTKLTAKKSTQGGNNIFISGKVRKTRQNLNESMGNSSKEPKLFTKARYIRLAEKRSRDKEDRAPPPSMAQLYEITKGPPPRRLSGDGFHQHNLPSSAMADATAREPHSQQAASPVAFAPGPSEPSSAAAVQPAQTSKHPKKRKSVRFSDGEGQPSLVEELMDTGMDLDGTGSSMAEPLAVVNSQPIPPDDKFTEDECRDSNATLRAPSGYNTVATLQPVRKLSLDAYQAQKQLTQSVRKRLKFGISNEIEVTFSGIPRDFQQAWITSFMAQDVLEVNYACFAKSKAQVLALVQMIRCSGSITSERHETALKTSADNLRKGLLGLFYHHPQFSMMILPTCCDEWAELLDQETGSSPADLSYKIFTPASQIGPMLRPVRLALDYVTGTPRGSSETEVQLRVRDMVVRKFFSFDYTKLLPKLPKLDTHNFFLAFPASQGFVCRSLCRWLRANNPLCYIYLAECPGSWAAFRSAASKMPGVVIVHETLVWTLHRFPGLDRYLGNGQDTYWCFTEPNHPRPIFPSITAPLAAPGEPQITRLFPYRTALLLTPSFLVSEPFRTCELLRWWLEKWSKSTTYKLVTAYNFHKFLGELALEKSQAREDLLRSSSTGHSQANSSLYGLTEQDCKLRHEAAALAVEIHIINQLRTGPYGKQEDFGSLSYADPSIDPNDEQSLVNWFGWWSSLRMDQFRKFFVVGSANTLGQGGSKLGVRRVRIPTYTRNTINDPDILAEIIQQRDAPSTHKPEHGGSTDNETLASANSRNLPTDLGPASLHVQSLSANGLTTVLQDIKVRAPGKHQWILYHFPVSHADFEMADHFGDNLVSGYKRIAQWFSYLNPFVGIESQPRKGPNTYIGFFYTITEEWDKEKIPKGLPRNRHPWIAVYRPVNPHTRQYHQLELIIWDVTAPSKFPNGRPPREEDLIDMQRRIIAHVRQYGEQKNPGMTFERVWLGGFNQPPCDSPYPLDMTLEFLDTMLRDLNNVLPASESWLREKGFKMVELITSHASQSRLNSSSLLDQDMDLDSSEDDDQPEENDTCIIFHPPRGRKPPFNQQSRCINMLYEAQQACRAREPGATCMEYQYAPTEEWYKDNRAEGRSYEHIHVSSWGPLFKHFKIGQKDRSGEDN